MLFAYGTGIGVPSGPGASGRGALCLKLAPFSSGKVFRDFSVSPREATVTSSPFATKYCPRKGTLAESLSLIFLVHAQGDLCFRWPRPSFWMRPVPCRVSAPFRCRQTPRDREGGGVKTGETERLPYECALRPLDGLPVGH